MDNHFSEYAARADVIFFSLFRRQNVGQNRRRRAVNEIRGKVLSGWVMIEEREKTPYGGQHCAVMNFVRKHTELLCIGGEFDPLVRTETQSNERPFLFLLSAACVRDNWLWAKPQTEKNYCRRLERRNCLFGINRTHVCVRAWHMVFCERGIFMPNMRTSNQLRYANLCSDIGRDARSESNMNWGLRKYHRVRDYFLLFKCVLCNFWAEEIWITFC